MQDNILFCVYFFRKIKRGGAEKVYRRIRDLRVDRDLLQKDLAEYLQCTQVYGTSIDYLLSRTDEKKPYPPLR